MASLQERTPRAATPPDPKGLSAAFSARTRGVVEPSKFRQWMQRRRPPYQMTERSWFVMLATVSLGIAMIFEPTVFITIAIIFAFTAWWRRESARQGIFTVAVWALGGGLVLVLFSILIYVIQNLAA